MGFHKIAAEVPQEAVAFLGAVGAFLILLVVFFLYLNKLLCFSSCGGFPCVDQKPKKKERKASKLGQAYAYEDDSSSSDSDDEVLKRFQASLEAGIKRSGSVYSHRGTSPAREAREKSPSRSPSRRRKMSKRHSVSSTKSNNTVKSSSPTDEAILVNETKEKNNQNGGVIEGQLVAIDTDEDTPVKTGSPIPSEPKPSSQHVSPEHSQGQESGAGSGELSPMTTSITTGSAHTLEGSTQIYENRAYDEGTISMSGSEQATDEHLFDVSDLQQESLLISKCGRLEVTFSYSPRKGRMEVTVHQAQEIPTKQRGGANNTQVRLLLLPTKKQRHKTKVKPGENPLYEETFVFKNISEEAVTGMGLRFRLYGTERMRRPRMIGESIIGFASLSLDEPSTHWVILEPRSNLSQGDSKQDVSSLSGMSDSGSSTQSLQHGGMPELLLGLAYNGTTGRLSVEVIKGSNFRNMAMNRAPDTYVKLTLMAPNGSEVAHSKTSVRRGQPNPLFKETFMFQVALFQLADVTLMVSVYNKKSMKKKEMIGWFSLGLNSSGEEENSHWSDMRESKDNQICRWHVLLES